MNTESNRLRFAVACMLTLSFAVSSAAANEPGATNSAKPAFRDVRLEAKGQLRLSVVSTAGQKVANQIVSVWFNKQLVCRSKSNVQGQVKITGLRPGLHVIQVGESTIACRLWTAQSAPPSAISHPAFVSGGSTVRGQYGPMAGTSMMPLAPAALATGVTAAALAVVLIAKSSSDDDSVILPASP